jgi:hypothetical protein
LFDFYLFLATHGDGKNGDDKHAVVAER